MLLVLFLSAVDGWPAITNAQFFWMPSAEHCDAALSMLGSLQRVLSAVCIGPDAPVLGWD